MIVRSPSTPIPLVRKYMVQAMTQPDVHRHDVTVNLKNGLHLRPQSQIAQLTQRFACSIQIHKGNQTVDAKSMLDLMTLTAGHGTSLRIEASGEDAAEALEQLVRLFDSNFETVETAEES